MRPIILGVVGDSATGKTTISKGIAQILGKDRVTVICTDNYHRFDREQRKELKISALHPSCNYINIMEQHLNLLKKGCPILSPIYNHSTGTFDAPVYIQPTDFVIIEGLLGFHSHDLRDHFDVKVYLDPPEDLRVTWKLNRDTTKRGYKKDEVLAILKKREELSEKYIRAQKQWSDIIVQFYPKESEKVNAQLNVKLLLRSTLAHPDLNEVVNNSNGDSKPSIRLNVGRYHDRLTEFLDVSDHVESEQVKRIKEILVQYIPELEYLPSKELGIYTKGTDRNHSETLAIAQMLIVYQLLVTEKVLRTRLEERF
ncbi:MAG: phosphoribulokinase [Candidatus Marinimicrobia bacterium]|nr:phosphoribulokinase [Candidatus Neomarinimicrobiota bacterium]MBL6964853.1 phosphoribulokinase [Bacteroidota bacterium]